MQEHCRIMPELPEVETVVRALRPALEGKQILQLDLLHPRVSRHSGPERLKSAVDGAVIRTLKRRGKFILLDLHDRPTLAIHLRMTGQLLLSATPLESTHLRAVFHLSCDLSLYFVDIRTFGTLFLLDGEEPAGYRSLGIEPLSSKFNAGKLIELADDRRTSIKSFLLDQRKIAGIGNIYASEALWRAGIDPRSKTGSLSPGKLADLADAIQGVLSQAVDQMGTTLSDFRRPDGTPGEYGNRLDVYGRNGQPCPRCDTTLKRIVQHGRSTFFCPRCQHKPRRRRR
jgi:formamidopyrimidine-DNA glycosylase